MTTERENAAWVAFLRTQEVPPTINGSNTEPSDDPDTYLRALLVDWPTFWNVDRTEAEWLAEPLIPAKRSVALFAPGGTGKSLLALWLAAALATGRPIFGRTNPAIHVLYLDYEMTEDDLHERLEAMGYDADTDLTCLHYSLLPSLPGLDSKDGGTAVVRLAELCGAALVVIDTFGRAVHGDENEADTVRAWYRWTGKLLKAAGRAFVRVDHAGKNLDKGQRGSSGKNDDVDIVWQMLRQDGDVFELVAKKRRMGWVPEKVELRLDDDDALTYALTSGVTYPAGTAEVASALAALGVPPTASGNAAQKALKQAGRGARRVIVLAAQRYRREHLEGREPPPGTTLEPFDGNHPPEPPDDEPSKPLHTPSGNRFGNHPEPRCAADDGSPVSMIREPSAGSLIKPDPEELFE